MRRISVLILALLVLVILPTWAVAAGKIIKPGVGQVAITIYINEKSGVVEEVVAPDNPTGFQYNKAVQPGNPVTGGEAINLMLVPSSPGHWCIINRRLVWCP